MLFKVTKTHKQITRRVNKAIFDYNMLSDGDNIVVGVSGGKDSMTLLLMLDERLKRVNYSYKLFPVYVDPGFEGGYGEQLANVCKEIGYELIWEKSDFGVLAHSDTNHENPCFLCSRLRRKRLFEIADSLNSSKLALGHNKDDFIETLFINMFYSGKISAMTPDQKLFDNTFQIIRPLAFVEEDDIKKFVKDRKLTIFKNPCPSAEISKRKEIKDFLNSLYKVNKNIKGNIFHSMSHVKEEYLLT